MKNFEGHPFIINLYGVVFLDLNPVVIVELAEDTITEYLAERRKTAILWTGKQRHGSALKSPTACGRCTVPTSPMATSRATTSFCSRIRERRRACRQDHRTSAIAQQRHRSSKDEEPEEPPNFWAPECTPSAGAEMKRTRGQADQGQLRVWARSSGRLPWMGRLLTMTWTRAKSTRASTRTRS